jgi:hypothetical protein
MAAFDHANVKQPARGTTTKRISSRFIVAPPGELSKLDREFRLS